MSANGENVTTQIGGKTAENSKGDKLENMNTTDAPNVVVVAANEQRAPTDADMGATTKAAPLAVTSDVVANSANTDANSVKLESIENSAANSPMPQAQGQAQGPAQGQVVVQVQDQAGAQPKKQQTVLLQIQPPAVMQSAAQVQENGNNPGKMDADDSLTNFKVLYVVTQLFGLTMIVLMGSWIGIHLGGLGNSDPKIEFNWHPLLMTIGLIYLYGNSILVYRGFRTMRKKTLKLAHASVHMAAFILTVIALKTVFDSHNLASPSPIPNMYSLHSWLGLSAVIVFSMQYVAGFVAYLAPGLKDTFKVAYMPLHIYFGLFGFVLAIASALMGITEKAIFMGNYSALPNSALTGNLCGVLFVIFGTLVIYLATEASYKRKALPEDTMLLTGVHE